MALDGTDRTTGRPAREAVGASSGSHPYIRPGALGALGSRTAAGTKVRRPADSLPATGKVANTRSSAREIAGSWAAWGHSWTGIVPLRSLPVHSHCRGARSYGRSPDEGIPRQIARRAVYRQGSS